MHIILVPLTILMLLVLTFPTLKHPLAMGLSLLLTTMFLALFCGSLFHNFWFSYTMVLILLGGLLVIFIYVALLASDEMFVLKSSYWVGGLMLMVSTIMILMNMNSTPLTEANMSLMSGPQTMLEFLTPLFGNNLALATIFLVLYLFLTLIVVIFNIKSHHTSLRSQNK